MKYKIERLLQSSHLDDIVIAINLAYSLPFEEFDAFFDRIVPVGIVNRGKPYYFIRNGKIYFWGDAYLGRVPCDCYGPSDLTDNRLSKYIDLTPDNYEGQDRKVGK